MPLPLNDTKDSKDTSTTTAASTPAAASTATAAATSTTSVVATNATQLQPTRHTPAEYKKDPTQLQNAILAYDNAKNPDAIRNLVDAINNDDKNDIIKYAKQIKDTYTEAAIRLFYQCRTADILIEDGQLPKTPTFKANCYSNRMWFVLKFSDSPKDTDWAQQLIDFLNRTPGFDVNWRNADGVSALHHAVYENNDELVEVLIKRGARVDIYGQFFKRSSDRYTDTWQYTPENIPKDTPLSLSPSSPERFKRAKIAKLLICRAIETNCANLVSLRFTRYVYQLTLDPTQPHRQALHELFQNLFDKEYPASLASTGEESMSGIYDIAYECNDGAVLTQLILPRITTSFFDRKPKIDNAGCRNIANKTTSKEIFCKTFAALLKHGDINAIYLFVTSTDSKHHNITQEQHIKVIELFISILNNSQLSPQDKTGYEQMFHEYIAKHMEKTLLSTIAIKLAETNKQNTFIFIKHVGRIDTLTIADKKNITQSTFSALTKQAKTTDELMTLVKELETDQKGYAFARERHKDTTSRNPFVNTFSLWNSHSWKGEKASGTWVAIMTEIQNRIAEILIATNDLNAYCNASAAVQGFLKEKTSGDGQPTQIENTDAMQKLRKAGINTQLSATSAAVDKTNNAKAGSAGGSAVVANTLGKSISTAMGSAAKSSVPAAPPNTPANASATAVSVGTALPKNKMT